MKRNGRRGLALMALTAWMAAEGAAWAAPSGVTGRLEVDEVDTCTVHIDGSAPLMVVCDAGGDGAQSCETHTSVSVSGIGYVGGCGITCDGGNYACCRQATLTQRANCSCQPYPPRGPYTPDTL